jgi:uncharacterized protein (DUF1810 family)
MPRDTPASGDTLQRFVDAQAPVFDQVCSELAAGRKTSHWMWFVFPQLRGLGRSEMARFYGLASADEARAYWRHPVLGTRLAHCAALVQASMASTAHALFGSPDDLKLRSCMTLFARIAPEAPVFDAVLARYFDGRPDPATLALLDEPPHGAAS